ncbi:MAG: hypothetical protein K8T91_09890 [Planctomycetes bacterium]|nr:hypothetical protein [Planctomycetota bacterium]
MAANRPNLGLQIALIIFVLITIALAVSTFMFYKENQESQLAKSSAEELAAKETQKRVAINTVLNLAKESLGRGPLDEDKQKSDVDQIKEEHERDKALYGATFPEVAQTYPQMLKSAADAYLILQGKLADQEKTIARLESEKLEEKEKTKIAAAKFNKEFEAQTGELLADRSKFGEERKSFEGEKATLAHTIEEKNKQATDAAAKAAKEQEARDKAIKELQDENKTDKSTIEEFQKVDYNAPDGTIVRVNQREHTVWIDRGRADGIKPQMIFSVYDRSASNIAGENVKQKGAIEVIRILDAHLSEATITKDDIKDPLMKEDKIMNPSFRAGKPERFAVAGFIDLDGDGQSDLNRLLTLISNNGGIVDAMIDDEGKMTGLVTPATKVLVLGDRPTENVKSPEALKSFTRMMKDANEAKVNTMTLPDFVKYMGYQGRERSVPLGKGATEAPSGGAFKKRPAKGDGGGAF